MRRYTVYMSLLTIILILSGCSTPMAGTGGVSDMQIKVEQESEDESRIEVILDESIISDGSWVMFEIWSAETNGSVWLQAAYEGEGIYSTETKLLSSNDYTLLGHFYAAGGFHFSRQYDSTVN
ncbi:MULTISPECIES: hypothetical protein [Paenibacillus]|uniref:Uncharacterized protein n=2 Tax=Paenibacillus TaxID=44249 RepID=A0A7Y6EUI5_9BACL|nr:MULTISPECIES: hypothetical protein [Paenibacillus]KGP77335.1 hypothetical protein P364_0133470 [Paenibacillus sp. MAEPY2]KGP82198.1 hypothetical protein P363_0127000 [Paenibacillus sp. MAEPY1]MDN4603813.1 hypothetical protein [Paenibacillus vandeheii]NUU75686.1 hypothetical protein [Paenibacillus xylanilyticus]